MAETAIKKVPTQAERQAQISAEVQESNARILDFVRGVAKAITTDIPGFIGDVVDKLAGDTSTLGEKDRSSQMFEAITGSKSTGSTAEKLGGVMDPKSLLKAIIVPAFLTKSLKDVKTAQRALEAGIDPAKVEDATKIFRLPENVDDGVLRAVIHPGLAEFNPRRLNFQQDNVAAPMQLEDVLNFPELYNLVPDLRSYRVIPEPGLKMNQAYHSTRDRAIGLGNASSKEDLMKSLLHEVQHGIQSRFNMNEGANPGMFYENVRAADQAQNILAKEANAGSKVAFQEYQILERVNDLAIKQYKRVAGEAEARAVEKMRSTSARITRPLTYYGDEYDLNRMIRSPQEVPKVDSDPVIKQIIQDALTSSTPQKK